MTLQPPPAPAGWISPEPKKPSSKRKWIVAGAASVAVLLVLAAVGSPDGQRGVADGAAAVLSPDPTTERPTPTAEPTETPEPTEAPTPEPTPEPTAAPDAMQYVEYLGWSMGYAETSASELDSMSGDLDNYDAASAAVHTKTLLDLNRSAVEWLEGHPPAACYADNHDKVLRAANHYVTAFKAQYRWLTDFPLGSDEDADIFMEEIEKAGSLIDQSTEPEPDCGF